MTHPSVEMLRHRIRTLEATVAKLQAERSRHRSSGACGDCPVNFDESDTESVKAAVGTLQRIHARLGRTIGANRLMRAIEFQHDIEHENEASLTFIQHYTPASDYPPLDPH